MSASPIPSPPSAPRRPSVRSVHGDDVIDDYAWMADRDDPELRAYLEAENAYAATQTAHLGPLVEEIFGEIKARTKETDLGVPVRHGGWWYYSRTIEGAPYGVSGRVRVTEHPERPVLEGDEPPAGEQVVLDENLEAEGHEFFSVGASDVSPDGRLLAWAVDVEGDERFHLRVREIDSGAVLDEAVTGIGYGVAWSRDGRHLFYTRVDEAWRPFQVWRHEVGTSVGADVLVLDEPDARFALGVGSSRDDRWVVIGIGSRSTSEYHLIDADAPLSAPVVVAPREDGVEYDVEPLADELLIVHNRRRVNFEVARAVITGGQVGEWVPLEATSDDEYATGAELFDGFAVVSLRSQGQTAVRVLPRDPLSPNGFGAPQEIVIDEPLRSIGTGDNPDPSTTVLQVGFTSYVTPSTVYDYDVTTRALTVVKQREVLGGYDPRDYVQRMEWVTATDGRQVPMSLVCRVDTALDGTPPGLLYGYGAYGVSLDPAFSVARLSLLDRGFVVAFAHVRGGAELGRAWYDDGKMEHKEHTFTDFVACADHLIAGRFVASNRLAAQGGSAGGLLAGVVANTAADRFCVVHLEVPFVDALTTVLDPSLPLTVGEWEEWGNPLEDEATYWRMKGYTPYENLEAKPYPALLVTSSLNDTRVFVTEPAKYVAKLRALLQDDPHAAPVLFRTELTAGHAGISGRYDAWRELAWERAVVIDQCSLAPTEP